MSDASRDELIPGIISEVSQMFAAAKSRWSRFAEEVHPELRGPGLIVLQTVLRRGPITATGLTAMLDMDKAVVSRQVAKLRSLGFVDAKEADSDRRVILLTATAQAREAIDELHSRNAAEYHSRFDDWTREELTQLQQLLHRFNAQAEDPRPDGPARRSVRKETEEASAE